MENTNNEIDQINENNEQKRAEYQAYCKRMRKLIRNELFKTHRLVPSKYFKLNGDLFVRTSVLNGKFIYINQKNRDTVISVKVIVSHGRGVETVKVTGHPICETRVIKVK